MDKETSSSVDAIAQVPVRLASLGLVAIRSEMKNFLSILRKFGLDKEGIKFSGLEISAEIQPCLVLDRIRSEVRLITQ